LQSIDDLLIAAIDDALQVLIAGLGPAVVDDELAIDDDAVERGSCQHHDDHGRD
jgi:hypothetical protein